MVNINADKALSGFFGLIDSLFTTEEEKAQARLKVLELHTKGELAQLAVNAEEAKTGSVFIAGWRPFIGWVCGASFAWVFVVQPMASFVSSLFGLYPVLPNLDLSAMLPVLLGMLGLGTLRTVEKNSGVERNHLDRKAR